MTRRKFIEYTVTTAIAIAAGVWAFGEKVAPKIFVRAGKFGKYPGKVKPLPEIDTQSKWSG